MLKRIQVLSCPQMTGMAQLVARSVCDPGYKVADGIRWGKFEHEFPDIQLNLKRVRDQDVVYFASFDNPGEIFHQWAALCDISRKAARSLTIILPFFPTGTMERSKNSGDVATAKSLTRLLDCIPPARKGNPQIVIFDIHALSEENFFDGAYPFLLSAMPLIKEVMRHRFNPSETAVEFPDDGARKRFQDEFPEDEWYRIICDKERIDDKRIVTIREGNARGKHVMIVDDLTRTGGTLINAAEAARRQDAASVDVFVPHFAVEEAGISRVNKALDDGVIDNFYTTDSCPVVCDLSLRKIAKQHPGKFHILPLAGLVVDYLKQYMD